jgi:hypothetical protein
VSPDARRIDVWFTPNPDVPPSTLAHLGLLGRIAHTACTIEPFHRTPDGDEAMGCVARHFFFCEALARREPPPPNPVQWIVASGRPSTVLAGLRFDPSAAWGSGVYEGPPLTRTYLVAVSELPETRDTLLVRLWGAGRVLARAIAELRALPDDAPERLLAMPILLRLRLELPADRARRSADDEEFEMSTQDIVEVWTQKVKEEGRREALADLEKVKDEGRREALADLEKVKEEGRDEGLADAVLTLYQARFGAPPADLAAVVRRTRDPATLRAWLVTVGTGSAADVAAAVRP